MSKVNKERVQKSAPWIALPMASVAAFFLGGWILGAPEPGPDQHQAHTHTSKSEDSIWTCSMHPQIRQNEPGQCPICGMDLVLVRTDSEDGNAPPERVTLSQRAKVRARIRTSPVRRLASGAIERRLLGRVDYDETTLRTVTAWVGGRIDRLRVRVTGERVSSGQSIATLYSPEVYSAHQDLISARQQLEQLSGAATKSAQASARAALGAARDRLRLLGVPERELRSMEQKKRPSEQVVIRTPFGGTVIERLATEGNYVKTGAGLYRIADLSSLWVQLDAYESDLPLLSVGQKVTLKVEALPGEAFPGRITFVDPVVNQRTRTTRVRIEVKNRDQRLRPGMFAEAIVQSVAQTDAPDLLVIPETAPLFTGRRSVVYVEVPGAKRPTYDARIVRLGTKMGDVYPVVAGLGENERVVTHGAFALDADLQIRGGSAMMTTPDDREVGPYDRIVETPDKQRGPLSKVVKQYLVLHTALADDKLGDAKKAATALTKATSKVRSETGATFSGAWAPIARGLKAHAMHIQHAKSLTEARSPFRDLSQQMATLLRVFGNPTKDVLRLAFCPMALNNQGAEWIQRSDTIENPYFGASMHSCGAIHSAVEHGTYLPAKPETSKKPRRSAPAGGHQH